jgi:hypothetical protein
LCVTKKGSLSQIWDMFLERLREKSGWDVLFTYKSRSDGVSYGGWKLEQHLSQKKYSSYVKEW